MSSRSGHLHGHLALVTGALGGLGRAVVRRLGAEGATVAVNDRHGGPDLDRLAAEVGGIPAPADVGDPEAVRAMVARVADRAGAPVDVLVANAA